MAQVHRIEALDSLQWAVSHLHGLKDELARSANAAELTVELLKEERRRGNAKTAGGRG